MSLCTASSTVRATSSATGPDVLEVDVRAVLVLPERLVEQVDVHRPRQRVGHAQRRRGEVVHLHVGVDAALEVAVAAQHRHDREVLGVDGVGDLLRQRAGVADARRAAVADEVEAELLEVRRQARALEVLGDDLRARGERGLHPRLDLEPALDGVLGQQAGAEHDRRVRGVGARGDRRDHHVPVVELGLGAVGERDLRLDRHAVGDLDAAGAAVRRPLRGRAGPGGRPADRRPGTTPRSARRPGRTRAGSRRAPSGTTPWTRSASRGPAGASGPRATARRRRGRARASRSRSAPPSSRRATGPARARRPRRSRSARRRGRRTPGSAASPCRSGTSRTWTRTPGSCCRSWRGRRAAGSARPARRTRRTCRPRRARAASA